MNSALKSVTNTFLAEYKGDKKDGEHWGEAYRNRLIAFRAAEESVVRLDRPTNLSRARKLGYKAKNGFVVVRVGIRKGSGLHRRPYRGRRPKQMGVNKRTRGKGIQAMAEVRAGRRYPNCEVLNSYWIGQDGKTKFFEVILVDRSAPEVLADRSIRWIATNKQHGRAERGLTSQGKKGRGLSKRGVGVEKHRPSLRAHDRKAK